MGLFCSLMLMWRLVREEDSCLFVNKVVCLFERIRVLIFFNSIFWLESIVCLLFICLLVSIATI